MTKPRSSRTPLSPRIQALSAIIREHWGNRPTREIAELAGESYGMVATRAADMGMPRLGTGNIGAHVWGFKPPPGIPPATLAWARENARAVGEAESPADARDAAMILALTGTDVRNLGWR